MSSGWGGGFGAGGGPPSPDDKATAVDNFTLTPTDIANGFITLNQTPTIPSETRLAVSGGTHAFYGTSFTVTGNQLSWTGLGLDGLLATGDQLVVRYPVNII